MKWLLNLLIIEILVITNLFGQIQTLTLYPSQTASVTTSSPSTPLGNYPDFLANAWTNGGPFIQRSMMQFDFSSIPSNAIIDSAFLSLYGHTTTDNPQGSSPLSGSNLSILRRIASIWNTSTVTWNNQPNTISTDSVILPESNSTMEDYLNIDIKNMVVSMINTTNNGFMMSLDTEILYRCLLFASIYNSDSTILPRLRLSYHIPDSGPVTCNTLYPTQTASISTNSAATPLSNYPDFLANAWTNGGSFIQRSLMQFDFSSIPNNAVIDSSLLSLFGHPTTSNPQGSTPLSGSNISVLRMITSPWNAGTVTWNNQPGTISIDSVILPESTSTMENFLNFDIKQMTIDMMAGNNGFMMSLDTEIQYRCLLFASIYNTDSTVLPRIKVCYSSMSGLPIIPNSTAYFHLYPSPASDVLNVEFMPSIATAWIEIFDVAGRLLESKSIPSGTTKERISVSSLANGIYFITLKNDQSIITRKFIKD